MGKLSGDVGDYFHLKEELRGTELRIKKVINEEVLSVIEGKLPEYLRSRGYMFDFKEGGLELRFNRPLDIRTKGSLTEDSELDRLNEMLMNDYSAISSIYGIKVLGFR